MRPYRPADAPSRKAFTPAEWRVIRAHRTPHAVQGYLNALPYNNEPPPDPATLRTFRGVVRTGTAHCLEAALSAAVMLEQHGLPPTVLSLESVDELDHVVFVYQHANRWGAIGRSRDPGLHGRRPVFRTLRDLAQSYVEPFIDWTGRITAYGMADLRDLGTYDWRLYEGHVHRVEQWLYEVPHRPIRSSAARVARLRRRFLEFKAAHPDRKPLYYDRRTWSALPAAFRR